MKQFNNRSGFTLIELLIVVAVLGVLAVGVLAAINVTGNINKANLAKAKTFSASLENSLSINQVGKWSFEDGAGATTFKDTSGYNNNGSCSGASCPAWQDKDQCGLGLGGCMVFNGSSTYIDLGTGFTDAIESAGTIAAWVYRKGNTGGIFARSTGSGWIDERLVVFFRSDVNNWGWSFSGGSGAQNPQFPIDSFPADRWVHFALAWNGSRVKTYLNGKKFDDIPQTQTPEVTGVKTRIGWTEGLGEQVFNGFIDEVAIYKEALTLSQIQKLYAQGLLKHLLTSK